MQSVNYEILLNDLLRENMSEDGFKLWTAMLTKITAIWNRPTSSTGKYHNKDDGRVPTVAEHTYEMLYAATKVMRMYGAEPKSVDADIICLGIALHDAWKYGENPKLRDHTANAHDMIAADMIRKNKDVILQLYSEEKFDLLEEIIRFHQGRWSTNVKYEPDFDWSTYHPYTHFIHALDMLSANNCLHSNNQTKETKLHPIPDDKSYTSLATIITGLRVKIDETIYDSAQQPILLILTDQDKLNITNMSPEATKYCVYPKDLSPDSIKEWMKDEGYLPPSMVKHTKDIEHIERIDNKGQNIPDEELNNDNDTEEDSSIHLPKMTEYDLDDVSI